MSESNNEVLQTEQISGLHYSEVELLNRIQKGAHFLRQTFSGGWVTIPHGSEEHKRRLKSLIDSISKRS